MPLFPVPEMFNNFNKFNKFNKFTTFTTFARCAKCANFDPPSGVTWDESRMLPRSLPFPPEPKATPPERSGTP